jgi:hypothetical protein
MNKTVYMTYHSQLPPVVIKRWKELNPDYTVDFSTDADCITFLEKGFNKNIAGLFNYITRGMYKADLWRLCKLYINGGVYADIDLIPFHSVRDMVSSSTAATVAVPSASFYSCLSMGNPTVFQAFMYHSRARNPLILGCLISFFVNKPYTNIDNGPTADMYHFLLYNVRAEAADAGQDIPGVIRPYTHYTLRKVRIPIYISSHDEDIIPLGYFPEDVKYTISISPTSQNKWVLANQDKYKMTIQHHCLIVERAGDVPVAADADNNHNDEFIVDIFIDLPEDQPEVIYLFQECIRDPSRISTCYIANRDGKNIMDCRDPNYIRDRGWIHN